MSDEQKPLIAIDETKLDKECVRLPSTYIKYAYATAEARLDLDETKAALELTEAELAKEIRANPEEYGLEKVTDKGIEQSIIVHPKYRKALKLLHTKKHELENMQAVLGALEMKKRSLTLLVDLHGMGYFAAPRISPAGREAVEEMTKRHVRRNRED